MFSEVKVNNKPNIDYIWLMSTVMKYYKSNSDISGELHEAHSTLLSQLVNAVWS
jgi:hypothetical protein